jgi:hypothetical protein
MTMDIYSHVMPTMQKKAMAKLDALLGGAGTRTVELPCVARVVRKSERVSRERFCYQIYCMVQLCCFWKCPDPALREG